MRTSSPEDWAMIAVSHEILCGHLCPSFHVETTAKQSNRQGVRDSRKVEECTDGRMRDCVPQHLTRSALQEVSWSKKLLPRVHASAA